MMFRYICALFLLPAAFCCCGIELVKDGRACAVIAVSENAAPGTMLAAKELRDHLKLISGADLPIVSGEKTLKGNVICVGQSAASRRAGYAAPVFKGSGFDIWVKGSCMVLDGPTVLPERRSVDPAEGADPQSRMKTPAAVPGNLFSGDCGPMHAVSAFLEHLGVRFYAPGKDGTIIPARKNIKLQDFRKTESAAFSRREYQPFGRASFDEDTAMWFRRLKAGSCWKRTGVLVLANVLRRGEKQHPEWAAYSGPGERIRTNDGCIAPRLLSPSLRKAAVREVLKIFAADPGLEAVSIQMPARRREADYRDFKAFRIPGWFPQDVEINILADFYRHVTDEVQKVMPGKKIIWQGSHNRNNPQLLKNTSGMSAMMAPWGVTNYTKDNMKRSYISQVGRLSRQFRTTDMLQREWWNEHSFWEDTPQLFWFMRTLQEIRKVQQPCVKGLLMDTGVEPSAGRLSYIPLTHLMFYVNSKLLWDPDLDLEALLQEYCTLWFGPAASEMRRFLKFAESICTAVDGRRSLNLKAGKISREKLTQLLSMLEKAEKCTAPGSLHRRRIAEIRASFSKLRDTFNNFYPRGERIQAEVFPYDHKLNCGTGKYKRWYRLPGGSSGVRTEFALAFREDRKMLFAAFRCYEPEMKKLKTQVRKTDDPGIFADDHIRVDFYTPYLRTFTFASNASGSFLDSTTDPEFTMKFGSASGWNPWFSNTAVKYFDDRWEIETAIGLNNVPYPPDWDPAWGINVSRSRYTGGKLERFSFAGEAQHQWCALTVPLSDCSGFEVQKGGRSLRPVPGVKAVPQIRVKRASGKVELDRAWETPSWKNVPETQLAWELWAFGVSTGFRPDVRVKMQYDDKYIYALFKVKDRYVRCDFKKDQQMVCMDSCVELFLQPEKGGTYFNIECNAIGSILMMNKTPTGRWRVPAEYVKRIKRFPTLPHDMSGEISKPVTWQLGLQIPIDIIAKRAGVSGDLRGKVWRGNIYKCADWSSRPHWLLWHRSKGFHAVEDFGEIIFE